MKQFGHARQPPVAPSPSPILLGPKDLPGRGICFHMNYLRKLWTRGDFPRPIKISARKIAWPEAVIDAWIASKLTEAA
jgi:Prophage CP4-57 regulatory protein (AlpA)